MLSALPFPAFLLSPAPHPSQALHPSQSPPPLTPLCQHPEQPPSGQIPPPSSVPLLRSAGDPSLLLRGPSPLGILVDAVPPCLPRLCGPLCSQTVAVPVRSPACCLPQSRALILINAPACTCGPDFALTDSLPGQHLQLGIQDVCQAPVPEPPDPCSSPACSPRLPIAVCSVNYSSSCVKQSGLGFFPQTPRPTQRLAGRLCLAARLLLCRRGAHLRCVSSP